MSFVLEIDNRQGMPATCVAIAGVMTCMFVVSKVQNYMLDGTAAEPMIKVLPSENESFPTV